MLGFLCAILGAVQLFGVTGENLRARAYFNANNVKVGDPMTLTVDFLGEADFTALHPPALSKAVDGRVWRVDDASAKTDTDHRTVGNFFSQREVAVSRTVTYRVRPLRDGVLWFPELEFEYRTVAGETRVARTRAVPVHARPGAQVVVEGMEEDLETLPAPPPLVTEPGLGAPANDGDFDWSWRRALAKPTADAFRDFDFPAGRMNEASCAILEGDWRRALGIYQRLEWRVGQTPEIERGMVAALALRYRNPAAELPVWRQVGRPLLRMGWKGRVGFTLGGLLALALVLWLVSRVIRALACVAVLLAAALAASPARAQMPDPFAEMEAHLRQMQQQMQQHMSISLGSGPGGLSAEREKPAEVSVRVELDRPELRVGEDFHFVLSLEAPRYCTLENLQLGMTERFGLTVTGRAEELAAVPAANPSNAVRRISVPARYDVPFRGEVAFTVGGMATGRRTGAGGRFSFSFSNSFSSRSAPLKVEVKPLDAAGQPADFAGVVATRASLQQIPDALEVGTNDVIALTYVFRYDGYAPEDLLPSGVAFEWERGKLPPGSAEKLAVVWKAYFVADGSPRTPELSISYYDPKSRSYRRARAGGRPIRYRADP